MRAREVGWITFLAGLPFAPFLDRRFDLWHGHAIWALGWLGVLTALTFWSGSHRMVQNPALALWLLWLVLLTGWLFKESLISTKQYPFALLLPFLCCLSVAFFYYAATQSWTVQFLNRLLTGMAWASVVVMGYCLLQLAGLDQFLKDIDTQKQSRLVGTIGNPTHLASYLAFTLPLLLLQAKHWAWKVAVGVNLLIIGLTNSIGGQLAAVAGLVWWCIWCQRRALKWVLLGIFFASLYACWHWQSVFNPYGRYQAWALFWQIYLKHPITGFGAGFIMQLSEHITDLDSPIFHWRHCHNEYLQLAIEQGVIGLGLLGYALVEVGRWFVRLEKTPLLVACTAILVTTCVNSLTTFPFHLWMLSTVILTAYAGVYVIAQETVWPPRAR